MDTLRDRNHLEALWQDGARAVADVVEPAELALAAAVDPSFWRGRRVLVTGHTGFKGAWLSLWLQSLGARVTGFADARPDGAVAVRAGARRGGHGVASIGDVRDRAQVARGGRGVPAGGRHPHGGAVARAPLVREPRETYETNVMGTVNVLDAVRVEGASVRAVVNVTSDKCYENREWEWGYREDEPMGGHDPYSSSKGCAELVTERLPPLVLRRPGRHARSPPRARAT